MSITTADLIIIGDLFKVSPCIKRSCGCQALLALTWHARLNIKNNWPNVPTQVSKMNVNMPEQLLHRQRLRLSCNFFNIYKNHPNPWSCSISAIRKVRPSKCPRLVGAEKVAMLGDQVDRGFPFQESSMSTSYHDIVDGKNPAPWNLNIYHARPFGTLQVVQDSFHQPNPLFPYIRKKNIF